LTPGATDTSARVATDGKHLSLRGRPFRIRGVTYGGFAPRLDGEPFPDRWQIKADFAAMSAAGLNTVRTYTVPPLDLVEIAEDVGLRLLVGLHYHDWRMEPGTGRAVHRRVLDSGRRAVAKAMERLAGRPSVIAVSAGNEVPADLVRLHGVSAIENTLSTLVEELRAADEGLLVTYTNYPTTEFLQVSGQDLATFNVFLEQPESFRAYLRHLQVACGDLPVLITELGLAGGVHGDRAQRDALEWQLRLVDESGCAGATVFSWTDEWAVDNEPVEGWSFGITRADRRPKPALETVSGWARSSTRDLRRSWPRISVVVCAYNGDQLIEKCLTSLEGCGYPDLEIIVCNDGSTDRTAEIARSFACRVLDLPRVGLGSARNAGLAAATGEIIAFMDADAFCHPEWPFYLALSLEDDNVVATGGPNYPVPGARLVERAVSLSPGGPVEVLLSDDRAEHVPGCNMAFRAATLEEIGGFDPVYTAAGDDVDVCWKVLDRGLEVAFAPAAQVRHHRRDTVRRYLRQQLGYGRAERVLTRRHPHHFSRMGQARWRGFIYGGLELLPTILRPAVYHGHLGEAPFQTVVRHRRQAALQRASALVPWVMAMWIATLIGAAFSRWWFAGTIFASLAIVTYAIAVALGAWQRPPGRDSAVLCFLVPCLHLAQPIARMVGRLTATGAQAGANPRPRWTGVRKEWLLEVKQDLERRRCGVRLCGPHSPADLEISIGPLMVGRLTGALLWDAVPVHRLTLRPTPLSLAVVVSALGLFTVTSWPAGVLALVGLGGAALECLAIRRLVAATMKRTTRGAPTWPES
jgi:glycosyltransferase involved in cell wall biosynthesis